jgi:pullulanase
MLKKLFFPLSILALLTVANCSPNTDMKRLASLDSLYSNKPLGCIVENGKTTFRVFAPRATEIKLVLFDKADDETGKEFTMKRDPDGVWEHTEQGELYGKFYGYKANGAPGKNEMWNPNIVVADPYSKAVATKNTYRHQAKTLILDTRYDWEGDTWVIPKNHNELIIYEAHVRDLTAHTSSEVEKKGTYLGLVEKGKTGGLDYLKSLGINAIELLPIHKFGTIEIPYRDSSVLREGYPINTWNPYARNHWGYMTSYFFTPETYYATDGTLDPNKMNGTDGRAVREFKDMVKALHKENIAVILDVVYNHVSQYDYNCFKYLDKFYYFRTDSAGNFLSLSGCGNDFKTERPMARRLIIESIKYWMTEYHIDGFRFDLAAMVDFETAKAIYQEAKKINPNVILIAEAWGGGEYEPHLFSDIGWASWNDQIRNGVKGQNPDNGLGFIFGKFQGNHNVRSLRSFVTGTLRDDGGLFLQKEHSINYLESHDDHTLGDFIRLGLHEVKHDTVITDLDKHAQLSPKQLALNKLAALFLFTAQGPVMIHEGQEFARSKVIAETDAPDKNIGRIDHNSYEKDNATNYINYAHAKLNSELVDYYKGLIALRKANPIFSSAPKSAVKFIDAKDTLVVAFKLDKEEYNKVAEKKSDHSFLVVMNGHTRKSVDFLLPEGEWRVIANDKGVSPFQPLGIIKNRVSIPASSGLILKQ